MTDDTKTKLAEGLRQAMQAEHEGHHFYSMAAATADDPKGKEVFLQLAADELDHFAFLKRQYESVIETGAADGSVTLGAPRPLAGPSPIFSAAIRDRIGEAHYEMTSLAVGIQLELSAETFYRQAAKEASDEAVAKFYNELADWESGHYKALLAQQEELQDDYWSAGGFSPF